MTTKVFNEYNAWKAYVDMHMSDANFEVRCSGRVFSVTTDSGEQIAWFTKNTHTGAVIERRLIDREFSDNE